MYYVELDRGGFYFKESNYDEFNRFDSVVECEKLPRVEGLNDIHAYRYVGDVWILDANRQLKIEKLKVEFEKDRIIETFNEGYEKELSKGIDVMLSDGNTYHFSLEEKDMMAIDRLYKDALDDFDILIWHTDGGETVQYSKADVIKIAVAAKKAKQYNDILLNYLKENLKEINDINMLPRFSYKPESLSYNYYAEFKKLTDNL